MQPDVQKILIDRERIDRRVRELGRQLATDLESLLRAEGSDPARHPDRVVMLPILTGAMVFTADLIRHMPLRLSIRVVTVSSYPGATTVSRGAALRGALPPDLEGRHVVVIDDILDSGHTLQLIRELVLEQRPASLRICVLLSKRVHRAADIHADYVGFEIPDEFVVGYGLDYDGFYRNLPDVAVLGGP
ncbi:MAG: hypoxanthine phosphoribosyltransferase [Planctomycetota bacterium]|nr:hypoxanthine phosphoribosyltransferase [Planctomycetota bacterium]